MRPRRECELIEDRLPPLLENDLPAGEMILVRAHLEDCPECAGALENLRAISDAIVKLRPSDGFTAQALERAKHAIRGPTALRPPVPVRSVLTVAAAAFLCITLFVIGPPSLPGWTALASVPRELLTDLSPIAARVPLPSLFRPVTNPAEPIAPEHR